MINDRVMNGNLNVRIDKEVIWKYKSACNFNGKTVSEVTRELLEKYIDETFNK